MSEERVEKKPIETDISMDSVDSDNPSFAINSTTNAPENQVISEKQDNMKGRHFAFVVYPESAPDNWTELLQETGLPFVVSPLHDKDINPDGTPKKAHYHLIVSWGNATTYKSARSFCDVLNCPRPQILRNVTGMYRYMTHKDNPEKYQYEECPRCYNGWVRPLDSNDVSQLKAEIWQLVYTEDCMEYGELLTVCQQRGSEYFEVASNNTLFFKAICDGYRHNPMRVLCRFLGTVEDDELRELITGRIEYYNELMQRCDERQD